MKNNLNLNIYNSCETDNSNEQKNVLSPSKLNWNNSNWWNTPNHNKDIINEIKKA